MKLKESATEFIKFNGDTIGRACNKLQNSLYGKYFGNPTPLEQVKAFPTTKWANYGEVLILDLLNGFLLICCASHNIMQHLFIDGPWSINGIILQLSP